MSLSALWMGLASLFLCVYLSYGLWQGGKFKQEQWAQVQGKINEANRNLQALESVSRQHVEFVEVNYQKLYEEARRTAHFLDAKFLIELVNAKDSDRISDALVPSSFLGVGALRLKLTFADVPAPEGYMKILKELSQWEKKFPLETKSIEGFNKGVDIIIDLYGYSRPAALCGMHGIK